MIIQMCRRPAEGESMFVDRRKPINPMPSPPLALLGCSAPHCYPEKAPCKQPTFVCFVPSAPSSKAFFRDPPFLDENRKFENPMVQPQPLPSAILARSSQKLEFADLA